MTYSYLGISTMEQGIDDVRHVLLTSPLNPGTLALAEMADGTLRLLRDNHPIPGCQWASSSLPSAVQKFQALKSPRPIP